MKLFSWLKGLFSNPKTTMAGIGSLAGAAAGAYMMYSNPATVNAQNIAATGAALASGLGLLASKDAAGQKVVEATNAIVGTANQAATALDVVQQVKALKEQADQGQKNIDTFLAVTTALQDLAPKPDTETERVLTQG